MQADSPPQARRLAHGGVGRNEASRAKPWYRRAKATKRRGMNGGKSERLDRTEDVEEGHRGRTKGGKRGVEVWTRLWEIRRRHRALDHVSAKQRRTSAGIGCRRQAIPWSLVDNLPPASVRLRAYDGGGSGSCQRRAAIPRPSPPGRRRGRAAVSGTCAPVAASPWISSGRTAR